MANSNIKNISAKIDKIYDMVFENYKNIAVIKNTVENQNYKIKRIEKTVNKHSTKIAEARGGLVVIGIILTMITLLKVVFGW